MYYLLYSKQTLQLIQNYEFSQGFFWQALLVVLKGFNTVSLKTVYFQQRHLRYTTQNVICWKWKHRKGNKFSGQKFKIQFRLQFLSNLFFQWRRKKV